MIVTDLYFRKPGGLIARPDGIALSKWCKENGIKSRIVLQSTAFEHFFAKPFAFRAKRWAKKSGVETRKKKSQWNRKA
ncbi:MAG: hypothetical protein QXK06_05075 [Candidatus Diapherotrites archaeon]